MASTSSISTLLAATMVVMAAVGVTAQNGGTIYGKDNYGAKISATVNWKGAFDFTVTASLADTKKDDHSVYYYALVNGGTKLGGHVTNSKGNGKTATTTKSYSTNIAMSRMQLVYCIDIQFGSDKCSYTSVSYNPYYS